MIPFATEFPVRSLGRREEFLPQVIGWLRGIGNSTVLVNRRDTEVDGETAYLNTPNGEELRLREFERSGNLEAIGFRHDLPDNVGRLWRTEAVVRAGAGDDGQDLIRLRTQCIARIPGAHLETPRKPYLIKSLLLEGRGGRDGLLDVGDSPLWLTEDDKSLDLASAATLGKASFHLPIVFVSATSNREWLLSEHEISRLAYDLGGVAHIVVEPSRAFSFRLRDETEGANVYGGTIGLVMAGRGIIRRFYLGSRSQDATELAASLRSAVVAARSQMPAVGWEWTELQEQALRAQRERERNRLSAKETENLLLEEINNLEERVAQLQEELKERLLSKPAISEDEIVVPESLVTTVGGEIYPGEFSDRIRLAARELSARAMELGLDSRSGAVLEAISGELPRSSGLSELLNNLKRATRDGKRVASEVTALLCQHGYKKKSDNRHIRLESMDGYAGLDPITLATTPSDHRSMENLRKQIERTLGLSKLPK